MSVSSSSSEHQLKQKYAETELAADMLLACFDLLGLDQHCKLSTFLLGLETSARPLHYGWVDHVLHG